MRKINIIPQTWPVAGTFRISRSSLTEIAVIRVEITENGVTGRGECRPYSRYNETTDSVSSLINSIRTDLEHWASRYELLSLLPPGAARNAIDCALWDLEAKQTGQSVWQLAGLPRPKPRTTAFTLSVNSPEKMAEAALVAKAYPLLKLKIGSFAGLEACLAVANARPDAQLIIDANEALEPTDLPQFLEVLKDCNIALIEQPFPAGKDYANSYSLPSKPTLCADESLHTVSDIKTLWEAGYRAVNVKLDKCGGLTAGLTLMQAAKDQGFTIMAGCMVGTSLAMAPMLMLESFANFIDLDGPLLLAKDIKYGLQYNGSKVHPPTKDLWG